MNAPSLLTSRAALANTRQMMNYLGSLRPSERRVLQQYAVQHEDEFIADLECYLSHWEKSDWLEKYNVEMAGKWVARHCSEKIKKAALNLATMRVAANVDDIDPSSIPYLTYETFRIGLTAN